METKSTARNNEKLVKEMLDLVANDSENLERTMKYLANDCVWIMEPGGTRYQGSREIGAFVEIAMSGRTHDKKHRIKITNWFANEDNLCIEYTHGAKLTGKFTAGFNGGIKTGVSRYCITYHMRNGKIDIVHEYINATSFWYNLILPFILGYLHWLTMRKLAREKIAPRKN